MDRSGFNFLKNFKNNEKFKNLIFLYFNEISVFTHFMRLNSFTIKSLFFVNKKYKDGCDQNYLINSDATRFFMDFDLTEDDEIFVLKMSDYDFYYLHLNFFFLRETYNQILHLNINNYDKFYLIFFNCYLKKSKNKVDKNKKKIKKSFFFKKLETNSIFYF